jgi:hypothetical protein
VILAVLFIIGVLRSIGSKNQEGQNPDFPSDQEETPESPYLTAQLEDQSTYQSPAAEETPVKKARVKKVPAKKEAAPKKSTGKKSEPKASKKISTKKKAAK